MHILLKDNFGYSGELITQTGGSQPFALKTANLIQSNWEYLYPWDSFSNPYANRIIAKSTNEVLIFMNAGRVFGVTQADLGGMSNCSQSTDPFIFDTLTIMVGNPQLIQFRGMSLDSLPLNNSPLTLTMKDQCIVGISSEGSASSFVNRVGAEPLL